MVLIGVVEMMNLLTIDKNAMIFAKNKNLSEFPTLNLCS
jgi:hypothetical protein